MTLNEAPQSLPDTTSAEFLPSTSSHFPGAGDVMSLISQSNTKTFPVRQSPSRPIGRAMNVTSPNPINDESHLNFEDSSVSAGGDDGPTPPAVNSIALDMRDTEEREGQGDHANRPLDMETGRQVRIALTKSTVLFSNWVVLLLMVVFSNSIFFMCYFEHGVKQLIEEHPYVSLISVIVCIALAIALEFTLTLRNKNPLVWILNILLVISIGLWTGSGVLIYDIKTSLMAKCWVVTIVILYFSLPKKSYKYATGREAEIVFVVVATIIVVLVAVACHMKTTFVIIGVTGITLALMSLSLVCEYYMKKDFKYVHKAFSLLEGIFYPIIALYLHLLNAKR